MSKRSNGEGSWGKKEINGVKYFRFRKIYNGERKEFYGKTQKEVRDKINDYEKSFIAKQSIKPKQITLEEYMTNWLYAVRINEIGDNTFTSNLKDFNGKIKGTFLGKSIIFTIKAIVIQEFLNDMSQRYARSTVKRTYYLINSCFNHMVKTHFLSVNPCDGVVIPSEHITVKKKKSIAYLNSEQVDVLVSEINKKNTDEQRINGKSGSDVYGINAQLLLIITYTGLRIGEALALKWEDVDLDNKILHIKHSLAYKTDKDTHKVTEVIKEPKYNSYRDIPLANKPLEAFQKVLNTNGYTDGFIFTVKPQNLSRLLKSILKNCNLPTKNFGLHSLRHTFGSILLEKGVELKVISELLGHKDITTTANIYVNVTPKLARLSIDVLN